MLKVLSLLIMGMVIMAVACTTGQTSSSGPSSSPRFVGGLSACKEWQRLIPDVLAGILTDAEIREGTKKINDRASTAEPEIRAAAVRMLRGATQGNIEDFVSGSEQIGPACIKAGHLKAAP